MQTNADKCRQMRFLLLLLFATCWQTVHAFSVTQTMSRKPTNSRLRVASATTAEWSADDLLHKIIIESKNITNAVIAADLSEMKCIEDPPGRSKKIHVITNGATVAKLSQSKQKKNNVRLNSKIRKFVKAGRVDIYRIMHSSFGIASLLIGTSHLLNIAFIHNFSEPISQSRTIFTGSIHCICGLFGVRRLPLKNKKEAARNAMFWPAMLQNVWLFAASLTEWGQGSTALFSMFSKPFITVTMLGLGLTCWQLSVVWLKTGVGKTKDSIWFQESWKNTLLAEFSYLIWIQIQMGASLYIANTVPHCDFSKFMTMFPVLHHLLANLALNTAYFNNLVVFLATLLRYKIISKPNHDNAIMFSVPVVTSLIIVWKVFACFLGAYGGTMSSTFISLLFH